MGRRKRIPYDPPHLRAGRTRRWSLPDGEHAHLTRRMFIGRGGVVAACVTVFK